MYRIPAVGLAAVVLVFRVATFSCLAASPPEILSYPALSSTPVVADNSTVYSVAMTASDADGYNDLICLRTLFNYTEAGGDQSKGRGYLAWDKSDADITRYGGAWTLADAAGGGRWGYRTDAWGGTTYVTPLSCASTTGGQAAGGTGTRTVTWTFAAKPVWASNPLTNTADAWVADASGNTGWRDNPSEFEVVAAPCLVYAATPSAPVLTNPTSSTLDLAINPSDSSSDIFAIRISPALDGKAYVQADGSLGAAAVWRTKAAWGTKTVVGLASSTTYTFRVRGMNTGYGGCPSGYGPGGSATTGLLSRTINAGASGTAISRGIIGGATRLNPMSSAVWLKQWDVLDKTSARGIAGGLDADTYNWKDLSGQGVGHQGSPTPEQATTLAWMRLVRDHRSEPLLTANVRGIGPLSSSGYCRFYYSDTSIATVQTLAADWVRYVNYILPVYRQGDALPPGDQAILDSINWSGQPKLLSPGEDSTPKVTYWELGNEPEVGLPWCTQGATIFAPTPAEYAARYKQITAAMLAVDPTIKVGPCITTANNGNAWLDAVLADPSNQVDFIAYHPYGPLYSYSNARGDTPETAESGLRYMKPQQTTYQNGILARITASGRDPGSIALIVSEYNPSDWKWECSPQIRRMAHALGEAETIFTFAEQGLYAANYWGSPAWCGDGTETPGYKVFEMMQEQFGDRLIDAFTDGCNLRIYTTRNSNTQDIVIWVLNFSNTTDTPVRLGITNAGIVTRISMNRLARLEGETSLFDTNDPPITAPPNIDCVSTVLTGTLDPTGFTMTFPHATITTLTFHRSLKTAPDGTPVIAKGKAVTAAYSAEGYLYIEEDDRSYGIRVQGAFSGISVGDRVDIVGTLTTRKPDNFTKSERQITATSIAKVSSGTPPAPLAMSCRAVGGGPIGIAPGVKDGVGANNIGLLVRIAGKVTYKTGSYIYVDDGSGIRDILDRVGVLVKCPAAPSMPVGSIVVVTGVVEGSIPTGWTTNRRAIRARTADDIVVVQ